MTTFQKKIYKAGNRFAKYLESCCAEKVIVTWTGAFRECETGVLFEMDIYGTKDNWFAPYCEINKLAKER